MDNALERIVEKVAERDDAAALSRSLSAMSTPQPERPEAITLSVNTITDLAVLRALETLADPALPTKAGEAIIINMPITGTGLAESGGGAPTEVFADRDQRKG